MKLKLIVIRSGRPDELAGFYNRLGIQFDYHRHGKGPMHYSAEIGGTVFEIYPLRKNDAQVNAELRLGFEVAELDNLLRHLREVEVKILKDSELSAWGYSALIEDPEGRKVELNQEGKKIPISFQLETSNYQLRFPDEKDIPFIYTATLYKGFNDGMLWEPPENEEALMEALQRNKAAWGDSAYSFTIEEKGGLAFLGRISIRKATLPRVWEVGFWTHPDHQQKGIMTEALTRILQFGFEKLKAEKIEACHAVWNKASEKVLLRNGFKFEAFIEQGFKKQGEWVAENKLSIHIHDWKKV